MRAFLAAATEYSVLLIDAIALLVILAGTLETVVGGVVGAASPGRGKVEPDVWLRYARWLVAGLTFQLAADIIETSVAPSWDQIGRVGAIAAIRTFLNFFLERDIKELRERRREPVAA